MLNVSGGRLAAETCRAGGLGFIAAGHLLLSEEPTLQQQINIFRELDRHNSYPLCLGFIGHSTFGSRAGWERFEQVLDTYRPDVVQFFAPAVIRHPDDDDDDDDTEKHNNIALAHSYNALVLAQVGSFQHAQQALQAGADGLMVQGTEAGGHGLRRSLGSGLLSLATNILPYCDDDKPVVAAGGMVHGRGLAAALALGCDGAVLGTRLWACAEALGHESFKQRLVECQSCDSVIRTTVFDQIQNSYSPTPWPWPFDSVGAVRNEISDQWDGRPETELAAAIQSSENSPSELVRAYRQAVADGNPNLALVHAGQGVGVIDSIDNAYDVVNRVSQEAAEAIQATTKLVSAS